MSWLRDNLWAFVALAALLAGAQAYAFSAFVEKRDKSDDAGEPRRALFKTLVFVALAGGCLLWFTRTDSPSVAPFQEH